MAVKTYTGMIAFVVCYGLISGSVQGTVLSSLPTLTTDLSKMGVRSGMVLSIVAFACLTGPPLARFIYLCLYLGRNLVILGSSFMMAARQMTSYRPALELVGVEYGMEHSVSSLFQFQSDIRVFRAGLN